MGDEEDEERRAPVGNRTIQIDALTDVQLVASDASEAPAVSMPPPLPRRGTAVAPESRTRAIVLTLLAVVLGTGFALAVVHYVFPAPVPPTPPVVVPSSGAARPVRQVTLDDEMVIHAGPGATEP